MLFTSTGKFFFFLSFQVSNNDYDGLGVLYSDIYFPDRVNYIKKSKFNGNKRHGISFRQLGMNIEETEIRDNYEAGIYQVKTFDMKPLELLI